MLKSNLPLDSQLYVPLTFYSDSPTSALEVKLHLTGNGRERLLVDNALDQILLENEKLFRGVGSTWVYISGPSAFISAGEEACKKRKSRGVEWYGAKWDV